MSRLFLSLLASLLLAGCFPNGEWIPTIWGGESIDDARAPEEAGVFTTDDGCEVALTSYVVTMRGGALLTPIGTASAVLPGDQLFDLAQPGPHSMASVFLERGGYPEVVAITGPASADASDNDFVGRGQLIGVDNAESDTNPIRGNADATTRAEMEEAGAAALLRGQLTCGTDTVALNVLLDDEVGLVRCPLGEFDLPGGSFAVSELVSRAEVVLSEIAALPAADDGDGELTMAELDDAGLGDALREAFRASWEADGGSCTWESGQVE
ncbi:MAG: hypothetical protein KDA24_06550 [Deltaproteobacteria bacterium]|nr:hypothetical protein [Deltaproteobacteria bacterium]